MRQRVRLVNLKLGDPADVEIYAGAACYDWSQTPDGKRIVEDFKIPMSDMYWTNGAMESYSVTVDIWADVEPETLALLKLSGLCQL